MESQALFPDMPYDAAVIGIGKLGLCFALTLERLAHLRVIGVDTHPSYVQRINEKNLESDEPGLKDLLQASERFTATTSLQDAVQNSTLVFILVQTPTNGSSRFYDHGTLSGVLQAINDLKPDGKHIVINRTVMPGYISGVGRHLLQDCTNTTLSYNPAFVAQGDVLQGYQTGGWFGMVLVGAETDDVACTLATIYERIAGDNKPAVCKMSAESAEITKLASNCFRTLKISFANMVGDLADKTLGADKFEISRALASDASIGKICITPGYGFGGPCYPRDNLALEQYCNEVGVDPMIPRAAHRYNEAHHDVMADELLKKDQDVYLFEDVTYKPRCALPMIDASPKLAVAERLAKHGKTVVVKDRPAVLKEVVKEYGGMFKYEVTDKVVPGVSGASATY